ncbi:MAG: 1,4-alpha-glucan branching enzyme [Thermoleophilia bacterium]|nr:1,4-alpha-glucan branching enzyme [Thermoleophilia bacterium]
MSSITSVGAAAHDAFNALPKLELGAGSVADLFATGGGAKLEALLPDYLQSQRWFAGKGQALDSVVLKGAVAVPHAGAVPGDAPAGWMALVDVTRSGGAGRDLYALPIVARPATSAPETLLEPLARVHGAEGSMVLADGAGDTAFIQGLHDVMRGQGAITGSGGERLLGHSGHALEEASHGTGQLTVTPLSLHTSNTSVKLTGEDGSAQVLKIVRRHDGIVEPGAPQEALDLWKGAYLTDVAGYRNSSAVYGSIKHVGVDGVNRSVASLGEFVPNDGDSWSHALGAVDGVLSAAAKAGSEAPAVQSGIEAYGRVARMQGQRLGELHVAFASGSKESGFTGVAATADDIAAAATRLGEEAGSTITQLRGANTQLPSGGAVDSLEQALAQRTRELSSKLTPETVGERIHTHGDFHLGQMLAVGDDVRIIDLEGAPSLPLAERWLRTSVMGDVARQRSSFEYAGAQGVKAIEEAGGDPSALGAVRTAADDFSTHAKSEFMAGWTDATMGQKFVPGDMKAALDEADLSNALYETKYELGSRPDWVSIPLTRLERLAQG